MDTEKKQETRRKIGQRIKKLRNEKRMTQEELAEKIGTVTSHVGAWEIGTKSPNAESLGKLFEVLGNFSLGE